MMVIVMADRLACEAAALGVEDSPAAGAPARGHLGIFQTPPVRAVI